MYIHKYSCARYLMRRLRGFSYATQTSIPVYSGRTPDASGRASENPSSATFFTILRQHRVGEESTHKRFRLQTTIGMRLPDGAPGCGDLPRPASLLRNHQIRRNPIHIVHQHLPIG